MMDEKAFREFCFKNNIKEEIIEANLVFLREFEHYIEKELEKSDLTKVSVDDLSSFIEYMINSGKNIIDNFLALIRYSFLTKREDLKVLLYEIIDGADVMKYLVEELKGEVDEETLTTIIEGIVFPPLGSSSNIKPKVTKEIVDRLEDNLEEKQCKEFLSSGLHRLNPGTLRGLREKFLAADNLDDFLTKKHQQLLENLENLYKEGTKFFTQDVDEHVIEYVKNEPTIESGVRQGDKVIITKIPYMTIDYLNEQDEQLKRYHYCHCPWVREALKTGDIEISPMFCYCSAGYYKQQWDAILDQPVKVEVLETILNGDNKCKFAVHLPKKFIP